MASKFFVFANITKNHLLVNAKKILLQFKPNKYNNNLASFKAFHQIWNYGKIHQLNRPLEFVGAIHEALGHLMQFVMVQKRLPTPL